MTFRFLFKSVSLILLTVLGMSMASYAQQVTLRGNDSTRLVNIVYADDYKYIKEDSTNLSILVGKVQLEQNGTYFYCDSCVMNDALNRFEAFGNVHIKEGDSTDIYSKYLRYYSDSRKALLTGNVKLTDKVSTLTTPELEYDMNTSIASYSKGGTLVNKTTKLTSKEGVYYNDVKDAYFKKDVVLIDPAYELRSDSLEYNTEFRTARFIAETHIRDSSGRTIDTREGNYNLATRNAQFGQNPIIRDGALTITGGNVYFDDSTGISIIERNGVVKDTAQGFVLLGNLIFRNNNNESMLATRQPLAIIKQDNDSIYISADTLFSARLSDLPQRRPGVPEPGNTDIAIDTAKLFSEATAAGDSSFIAKADSSKPSLRRDSAVVMDSIATAIVKNNKDSAVEITKARLPEVEEPDSAGMPKRPVPPPETTSLPLPTKLLAAGSEEKEKGANPKDSLQVPLSDSSNAVAKNDSTNRYFEGYHHVRIYSDSMQAASDSMFYSFRDSIFRMFDNPVVWSKQSQITGDTIYVYTKNKKPEKLEVYKNSFIVNEIEPEIYNQISGTRLDGYFVDGELDSVRVRGDAASIYFLQDEDSAYSGINEAKADILDAYFANRELQRVVFRSEVSGTLWPIQQKSPAEMRLPNFQWLEDRRPKTKYDLFE